MGAGRAQDERPGQVHQVGAVAGDSLAQPPLVAPLTRGPATRSVRVDPLGQLLPVQPVDDNIQRDIDEFHLVGHQVAAVPVKHVDGCHDGAQCLLALVAQFGAAAGYVVFEFDADGVVQGRRGVRL